MSKRLYGSVSNRFEEGRNYTGREVQVGDDITMYYWSDRTCYYITKVVDQKHIFVKRYHVCADHSKPGGMGHQNWLYFKTLKEKAEYLNSLHLKDLQGNDMQTEIDTIIEDDEEEWIFRYNHWKSVQSYDKDRWLKCLELAEDDCKENADPDHIQNLARYYLGLDDQNFEKVVSGQIVKKYYDLNGKISFGVRDYYYDWEF